MLSTRQNKTEGGGANSEKGATRGRCRRGWLFKKKKRVVSLKKHREKGPLERKYKKNSFNALCKGERGKNDGKKRR